MWNKNPAYTLIDFAFCNDILDFFCNIYEFNPLVGFDLNNLYQSNSPPSVSISRRIQQNGGALSPPIRSYRSKVSFRVSDLSPVVSL